MTTNVWMHCSTRMSSRQRACEFSFSARDPDSPVGEGWSAEGRFASGSPEVISRWSRGDSGFDLSRLDARAIWFDVGGILFDDSAWQRWLLQLVRRMGLATTYTGFYRVWKRDYQPESLADHLYWPAMRSFLRASGLSAVQVAEVEAAGAAKRVRFQAGIRPYPGVRAALAALATRGIQLGILCSQPWDHEDLLACLSRLDLAGYFRWVHVISPGQHPNVAVLRQWLAATSGYDEHVAYLGCDPRWLAAADDAGMLTLALNQEPDATAAYSIAAFSDLLSLGCRSEGNLAAAG